MEFLSCRADSIAGHGQQRLQRLQNGQCAKGTIAVSERLAMSQVANAVVVSC